MKLPKTVLLTLLATAVARSTAQAQSVAPGAGIANPPMPAPAVTLAPVRVTADLWASPLDRTPASVSVFGEAALQTGAVRHFGDLVDQIPNFTWSGGTSRPRYFQIRGVGENSQYEGETPDSAVRFLVDDLDFTGLGGVASTFDVQQVEILRGPQAGAFGANAAGGLVRVVTAAPTTFASGKVETTFGEDGLRTVGAAWGGPLLAAKPEMLMARVAVQHLASDGFRRNVTLNRDTNARDELNARLRLTWNPTRDWRWETAVLYSELDNGFDEFALDNNGTRTISDRPGRDTQDSWAASLRGTFSGFAGVRLATVTAGTRIDSVYSYDDDWTAASYDGFSDLRRDRNVFTQELRLDSTATRAAAGWIDRWTLGGYFARITEASAYTNEDPGNRRGLRTDYAGDNGALFGQVGHDFTPHTRLVVGLRAERIELEGAGWRTRFRKARGTFDPVATFAPRFADTMVGGKLTLERDLASNLLGFASVTRGYKGGGVNIDARINPPADPLTYATEKLWNYEIGLRGNALEQRLAGEVTAFYLQRRETQVRDSAGFGGNYRFFTANGRDADVLGLEASATLALTRGWSVHGSVAHLESELDRFTLTNGSRGGGRDLANAPHYGYTAGLRYRSAQGLFAHLETVGKAKQFDSNNHDEARRAFGLVNASLGYAWRGWTFTVWGRNLGDERYEKRVFFFGNEDPDYVPTRYESRGDPRQFGVTAGFRF
jgi:outer membrane receptor protein involved in Fe transport